jgi:carboxyl-terminal processing protease
MLKFWPLKILLLVVFIFNPSVWRYEEQLNAQENKGNAPAPVQKTEPSEAEKRREAFEITWQTVKDFHFDPTFGGLDWDAVKKEYAPRVERAQSDRELHALLQEMLNRLGKSHFNIIPPEAIPVVPPAEPDAASSEEKREEDGDDDDNARTLAANGLNVTERLSHGIGIDLRLINHAAIITRVEPDSTAARAGLRPGYILKSVNGESLTRIIAMLARLAVYQPALKHQTTEAILVEYFNGPPDTFVRFAYLDSVNALHRVRLKREKLKGEMSPQLLSLPPQFVEFEAKRLRRNVGYIRFNVFAAPVLEKFCAALRSMRDAPGIIIDLRGNRGGLLGLMYGMGGLLETRNISFGTMKTRGGEFELRVLPQKNPYNGALVILIDEYSLSASEMFAAGIRESGRGLLVGTRSAGSALPSIVKELPTGAILQYAFADIATPWGNLIEGKGITPDINVRLDRRSLLKGHDAQLEAAIDALQSSRIVNSSNTVAANAIIEGKVATATGKENPDAEEIESGKPLTIEPEAARIIENYVKALGGREALEKIQSRVSKGTFEGSFAGLKFNGAAEIIEQQPDKSMVLLTVPTLGIIRKGYTGAYGYEQIPLFGFRELEGGELATIKASADIQWPLNLQQHYSEIIFKEKVKIEDTEVNLLLATYTTGSSTRLYFDTQTGLLVRRDNVFYEDYRAVDGVMVPHTTRTADTIIKLTEVRTNVAIEDARFIEEKNCFTQ